MQHIVLDTNSLYLSEVHFDILRSISFPVVDVINIDAFLKVLSIPQEWKELQNGKK